MGALFLSILIKLSNFDIKINLFCNLRSINFVSFGIIVYSFIFLGRFWSHKIFRDKSLIFLIYPFLSLLAVIFFTSKGTDDPSLKYSKNIDAYRIIAGSYFMFLTAVIIYFHNYIIKDVYSFIYRVIWSFAVIYLVAYILIRFFNYQPLLYGEGTPALFFPFDSPNQAAVLLLILLFLALGLCVFLKKTVDFIILCPIFSLAGFQTGSRTYGLIYFLLFSFLILTLFMRFLQRHKIYYRELLNILFAILFTAILVISFNDRISSRTFSLFGNSLSEIIFKSSDSYRYKTNVLWGKSDDLKFDLTPFYVNFFSTQCISNSKKDDISNSKKVYLGNPDLHNVFLEFFVFGGVYALAGYLLFISSLIYFSISLILLNFNSLRLFFLKFTYLACLLCVFAFQYTNPIFGLKFIWLLYGFIIGMFLISKNKLI